MRLFFFFLVLDPFDPNQLLYILLVPIFLFPFYFTHLSIYLRLLLFLLLLFLHGRIRFLFHCDSHEVHPVELHECLRQPMEVRVLQPRHQLQLARPQLLAAYATAVKAAFRRLRETAILWQIADTRWSSCRCDYRASEDIGVVTGKLWFLKH